MLTKNSYVAFDVFSKYIENISHNSKKYSNLKKLWEYFENFSTDYEITELIDKQKTLTLSEVSMNPYIDKHLKKDIILLSNYKEVTIRSGIYTFHLHIHYLRDDDLQLLIDTLGYVLSFTSKLGPNTIRDITITYYLLDVKRVFDNDSFFDKEEVNGGACWLSDDECQINIWRKEEIIKVSIHELIHGLSYDYKQDSNDIVEHYKNKYKITSKKMNTFEAYTEIFAELIHSYLIARLLYSLYPNLSCYTIFKAFVLIETQFSRLQSSKVLYLSENDPDANKETNVMAYYVIKTELYNDINGFLGFCINYNDSIIKIKNISKYFDYLKKSKKVVKKNYSFQSDYLMKTTRMTCLELDLF